MSKFISFTRGKISISDIYHYIIGNLRYKLYYFHPSFLRKHIREQIDYRILWMDKECYYNGSCKICGCSTTALQMANKSCDKPCYPSMMTSRQWKKYKSGSLYIDKNGKWIATLIENNKPVLFKVSNK